MDILPFYFKKYWKLMLASLALASINQIFSLIDPIIFKHVVDDYATKFSQYTAGQFIQGVGLLLLAAIGVAFVSRTAKNFQDYYINTVTQKMGANIYTHGVAHSLDLPYSVFEDQRSGETLGKLQKVRTDVEKLVAAFVNVLFVSLVGFIFVMIYATRISWVIALVYFATVPIIATLSIVLSKRIKAIQAVIVKETTALAGATTESLRNIELVKSLGLAKQEVNRLNSTTDEILKLELKKVKYMRTLSFIQGTTINFLRNAILFIMLYLMYVRAITFGEFFSLYFYSFFIFGPLQDIGNIIATYREAEASLNNFKGIMSMPKEAVPTLPVPIKKVAKLEFDKVTFQHQSALAPAVSDISFTVKTGKTIAFVGPSGAGKTTLVKLLVGLYTPKSGGIYYNDMPSDKIDMRELRNQIGFVTQDTQLFAGTIRDNLLFVNPNATDAECIDVLQKAACESLLARAPEGLDTIIGEGGVKVSGGEKQRLSIARALLRQPNILVFDEATSSLDSMTEEEISLTVRDLSATKERITILIAHRLSTIMHAETIYVLEKGAITESGTHKKLLTKKGLYYAMWRQQVGER